MAFNLVVVVREIWDTRDLAANVLDETGKLKPGALQTRFDPEDLNALEMALQIKDKHGGTVTALAAGEPRSVDVLRECLYRGVDNVVRLGATGPLDTQAMAALTAKALGKLGAYDLVLLGLSQNDGENSLLGPHVAGILGIEQITWVDALEEIAPGRVVARRSIEMGHEWIEAQLPAVLSVGVALLKEDPRAPRSAKATLKLKHKKTEITAWSAESLNVPLSDASTIKVAGLQAIAPRVIESRDINPDDEAALKGMLSELVKGV